MKSKLYTASTVAVAATLLTALVSAQGSGAVAQDTPLQPAQLESVPFVSQEVVQPLPNEAQPEAAPAQDDVAEAPAGSTLAELVAAHTRTAELSPEMRCLAGAIYFEAKSESLPGQLAV